jgi:hypothetical protein
MGPLGEPDGVGIGYFIGMKRLDGDSYTDLWYDIKLNGKRVMWITHCSAVGDQARDDAMRRCRGNFCYWRIGEFQAA